ncbi:MAG: DNA-methyltransferase, partial [Anaerovoracaceae bacterium]
PFFTERRQSGAVVTDFGSIRTNEYDDSWKSFGSYMRRMAGALCGIRELLSDRGLVFVHLDWHVVHDVRVMMDEIFGEKNFVNEIIWTYKSGGSSSRRFSRKHDNIIVYSKTGNYRFFPMTEKSYNRGLKPYRFKGVSEYKDEIGWYTNVNMKDVWDINMVGRTSGERTGYATQKPEQLLDRIIRCCTEPGDTCADFFCGSGTTAAAAVMSGRNAICCDVNPVAVEYTAERLCEAGADFTMCTGDSEDEGPGGPGEVFTEPGEPLFRGSSLFVDAERISEGCYVIRFDDRKKAAVPEGSAGSAGAKDTAEEGAEDDEARGLLDRKSYEVYRKCLENDPFQLVRMWSFGVMDGDGVYEPCAEFVRGSGGIERENIVDVSGRTDSGSRLVVKIADILGRVFYREI